MKDETHMDDSILLAIAKDDFRSFQALTKIIPNWLNKKITQSDELLVRRIISTNAINIFKNIIDSHQQSLFLIKDEQSKNILQMAIEEGSCAIVEMILDITFDFSKDIHGNNELHKYVTNHSTCEKCLVRLAGFAYRHNDYFSSKNKNKNNPLHLAVIDGNVSLCQRLMENFTFDFLENGEDDNSYLHLSARHNDLVIYEHVKYLATTWTVSKES